MNNEELQAELKSIMTKIRGTLNLLRDAKVIVANNKLFGVYQKLGHLLNELNQKESDSDNDRMIKYGNNNEKNNE